MLNIETQKELQDCNSMAVPSRAEFFAEVSTQAQVLDALNWAQRKQLPQIILGGGSNVVLNEELKGLVIRPAIKGIQVYEDVGSTILLRIGAGENWHELVCYCVQNGYYGIENLALIPGSVGAAPIQNIGAYGVELQEVFHSLTAINKHNNTTKEFTRDECEFCYRESIFKRDLKNEYLITHVTLKLSRVPKLKLHYPALARFFCNDAQDRPNESAITPRNVFDAVVSIRTAKLPNPATIPNAGSFFKNPIVSAAYLEKLKAKYPQLVYYDAPNQQKKIAAAWLIDSAGWKGKSLNGIQVYDNQALVITNRSLKPGSAVIDFANAIRDDIKIKYDIPLEIEPRLIGF